MCRNIKPLNNLAPPATTDEVHDAALQYVRKIAGTRKPSKANQEIFDSAIEEITAISRHLLGHLVTTAPPRDRDELAEKARERFAKRMAAAS